jgi:aspartate/methionine/tyrosine aminotransferase
MASWRIGYVVYPLALSVAMNKVQDTNLICAPVVSQLLATEALKRADEAAGRDRCSRVQPRDGRVP